MIATAQNPAEAPTQLELLTPANDTQNPIVCVLIPAMNERITIAESVDWCQEGFARAGVVGEVLIVDSSRDETPAIALEHGARVLRTPKRGLGRAYIDSIPYVRADFIVMGDADCTYDFRELGRFVEQFRNGFEYVMGSRFAGSIEDGAMPGLHRYFGTPLTTAILNFLYSSHFSDIHCGMRGITKSALKKINLQSQSWEYASEMVLKSVCMDLQTTEVPVTFYKDRTGRSSHMKRGGFLEPWRAGWVNLRVMLIHRADFFVFKPGLILTILGALLLFPQTFGPVSLGPVTLSLYWGLLGCAMFAFGLQFFCVGCFLQVMYGYSDAVVKRWLNLYSYTRGILVAGVVFLLGLLLTIPLLTRYFGSGLRLPQYTEPLNHMAVSGLALVIAAFTIFSSTLAVHAAALKGASSSPQS